MDKVKVALQSLALDIIQALDIAIVYLLPALLVVYFSGNPAYGPVVNILEIIIGNQIKKNFPDSSLAKIF